jgi:hypothetical protein
LFGVEIKIPGSRRFGIGTNCRFIRIFLRGKSISGPENRKIPGLSGLPVYPEYTVDSERDKEREKEKKEERQIDRERKRKRKKERLKKRKGKEKNKQKKKNKKETLKKRKK